MKFIWTSTYACTRAHVHIHLINKTYTLHAHMRIMCTRTVVELSHAAQARKHTRARTGCTCPVFIEAPVFQQERAAAHHQCHHQCSRSRSTHAAPKPAALNVNPTLQAPVLRCNPQTGTSAPWLSHAAPVDADMSGQYIRNGPPGLRWVHHTLDGRLFHLHQGLDLPPRTACFSV